MIKKTRLIIPPNCIVLLKTFVFTCALIALWVVLPPTNSVRWSGAGEFYSILMVMVTLYRTCFHTFHQGYIAVRFLGIPVSSLYYHECSSCTIVSGFSDPLSRRKATILLMTFSPNRPFRLEQETVMEYIESVGKKGLFESPKYVRITIPPKLVPQCIEVMKEYYPNLQIGEEIVRN